MSMLIPLFEHSMTYLFSEEDYYFPLNPCSYIVLRVLIAIVMHSRTFAGATSGTTSTSCAV